MPYLKKYVSIKLIVMFVYTRVIAYIQVYTHWLNAMVIQKQMKGDRDGFSARGHTFFLFFCLGISNMVRKRSTTCAIHFSYTCAAVDLYGCIPTRWYYIGQRYIARILCNTVSKNIWNLQDTKSIQTGQNLNRHKGFGWRSSQEFFLHTGKEGNDFEGFTVIYTV